jgi:hypothetical protein
MPVELSRSPAVPAKRSGIVSECWEGLGRRKTWWCQPEVPPADAAQASNEGRAPTIRPPSRPKSPLGILHSNLRNVRAPQPVACVSHRARPVPAKSR